MILSLDELLLKCVQNEHYISINVLYIGTFKTWNKFCVTSKSTPSSNVSAQLAPLEGVEAMPLSTEQILALKQGDTKRSFQMEKPLNLDPKRGKGSKNTKVRTQLRKLKHMERNGKI